MPGPLITPQNIAEVVSKLRQLLGEELFARLIGGYDSSQDGSLAARANRRAAAHPFAVAWDDFVTGARRAQVEGRFEFSEMAYFLMDDLSSFEFITADPLFPDLLSKLVGKKQYFSTLFEAYTFSFYADKGYPTSLVPTVASERRPDIVCEMQEVPVYIECKSLEDDARLEEQVWLRLESRVGDMLDRTRSSYRISVTSLCTLRHVDVDQLVRTVRAMISEFPKSPLRSVLGHAIKIDGMPLPISVPNEDEGFGMDKLSIVEWRRHRDIRHAEHLERCLREAAAQLPQSHPGVVHLQVPYRCSRRFADVVDDARPRLERALRDKPHVCAIVISGRFLNDRLGEETEPLTTHYAIIPNYAARFRLPSDFHLPKSVDFMEWVIQGGDSSHLTVGRQTDIPAEGTIVIEMKPGRRVREEKGRYLLSHCSADGRQQIALWQNYRDEFQIEVLHEKFGRRTLTGDLNSIPLDGPSKLAISWNEKGIICAVNGRALQGRRGR